MRSHFLKKTAVFVSAVCFAIAFTACKGADSNSKSKKSNTPTPNQDTVFSSSKKVSDGDLVSIVSSDVASNSVWFAPVGTTTFAEGATMTKAASGTATAIATPTALGEYHLYLVSAAGKVSTPSTAVLTVTEWVQDAYLKASNNDATNDWFGDAVAINGDWIVVGASREDSTADEITNDDGYPDTDINGSSSSGAAYIFKKGANGEEWVQDAYLKASNSGDQDEFGISVAISGNLIVVGADAEDSTAGEINNADGSPDTDVDGRGNSGAAYVFRRETNGEWVQDAYLKASNSGADDQFGYSVAISGDLIVVGAYLEDSTADVITNTDGSASSDNTSAASGAVYVFKREGDNWIQDAYLKASNSDSVDRFGRSVAISGDLIVVGAFWEDSTADEIINTDGSASLDNSSSVSGAAYVFKRKPNGEWIQDAYLKASNSDGDDRFGISVAISGDLIVVGAHQEDSTADVITNTDGSASADDSSPDSGAAYVFKREGDNWIQDAYLKASNSGRGDQFGYSVAISGDLIVVGAYYEDSGTRTINNSDGTADTNNPSAESGAAYLFKRNINGEWVQDAYLKASNGGNGDEFGYSVAISGNQIVVGAHYEDSTADEIINTDGSASDNNSAKDSGAAYIFKR